MKNKILEPIFSCKLPQEQWVIAPFVAPFSEKVENVYFTDCLIYAPDNVGDDTYLMALKEINTKIPVTTLYALFVLSKLDNEWTLTASPVNSFKAGWRTSSLEESHEYKARFLEFLEKQGFKPLK